jgi:multisubunit Na+/H+ antiporter MnhF subunit
MRNDAICGLLVLNDSFWNTGVYNDIAIVVVFLFVVCVAIGSYMSGGRSKEQGMCS